MKTFAVLTTAALFGFTFQANAENLPSLYTMHAAAPALEAVSVPVAFTEAVTEASLEVESWMTNESFFVPLAVPETEEPMGLEEWMINNEKFVAPPMIEESDPSLAVENWMLDPDNFSTFTITGETEKALDIESWMLNENTFGR